LAVTFLYALPFLLVVTTSWDYSMFACESVSYRYFACFRLQHGEGSSVWLPQGQLLGLIQHALFSVVSHFAPPSSPAELRWSVNLFGLLTTLTNIGLVGTVFFLAGQSRWLAWSDKVLLFVTGLAPIFLTGEMGPYYSILPDYHALNMALLVAGLYLFLLQVRGGWSPGPLVLGMIVGALLANKVSMIFVAAAIVSPTLVPQGLSFIDLGRPGAMS
jgi:hypothetical protein